MGYRAYQEITQSISRHEEKDKEFWPLIHEDADYAMVHNTFYICSAYQPDEKDKEDGPAMYWLQETIANDDECRDIGQTDLSYDTVDLLAQLKDECSEAKDYEEVKKLIERMAEREGGQWITVICW